MSEYFTQTRGTDANATATTVSSARSVSGTSLTVDSLDNWSPTTGNKVHFITYKKTTSGTIDKSTQCDWTAIIPATGTTLTSLTLQNGTDAGNDVGDFVEMASTAAWSEDLYNGLAAIHNTDGTLQTGIIATAKIADGAVTTPKLAESAVTADNIDFTTFPAVVSAYGASSITLPAGTWAVIHNVRYNSVTAGSAMVWIYAFTSTLLPTTTIAAPGGSGQTTFSVSTTTKKITTTGVTLSRSNSTTTNVNIDTSTESWLAIPVLN